MTTNPAEFLPDDDELDRLLSPALFVYLDRVRHNVARVLAMAGGNPARWRPHVKTSKIPEVWQELTAAGLRRFKCATTREAATLLPLLDGHDDADLLVAFPHVGPSLARLGALGQRHRTRLSVLCESPADVDAIPASLDIFVDLNPGMNRTGVPAEHGEQVLAIARRAGERFRGLHYYDGHLHGAVEARREAAFAGYDELLRQVETLSAAGVSTGELITSGTPAFSVALEYPGFAASDGPDHQVSPGTVTFHDGRSAAEVTELDLEPAALVFSRIVSRPAEDIVTCDAGSKALAAEAGDPCAEALGHPGLKALRPSEEHLPLQVQPGYRPPQRGTALLLFPWHVCPTVNLAEQAVLLEGRKVVGVVEVSARAHELHR